MTELLTSQLSHQKHFSLQNVNSCIVRERGTHRHRQTERDTDEQRSRVRQIQNQSERDRNRQKLRSNLMSKLQEDHVLIWCTASDDLDSFETWTKIIKGEFK